jgi:two-component system chemotaxis sensor kinase CheA
MTADPYKYFRVEARELLEGMSAAVLTLEKGPAGGDLLARLLRQAHTLKGAARVVRLPEIAELAHRIEDLLAPHRDGATAPSRETVDGALRTLDAIAAALAPLEAASAPAPAAPAPLAPTATSEPVATDRFAAAAAALPSAVTAPPPEAALDSVRIEIHALDALLHEVAEAAAGLTALRATEGVLARARRLAEGLVERLSAAAGPSPGKAAAGAAELSAVLEQLERGLGPEIDRVEGELRQLRTGVDELRLLPVSAVFGPLDRAVRDAARTTGKAVELEGRIARTPTCCRRCAPRCFTSCATRWPTASRRRPSARPRASRPRAASGWRSNDAAGGWCSAVRTTDGASMWMPCGGRRSGADW